MTFPIIIQKKKHTTGGNKDLAAYEGAEFFFFVRIQVTTQPIVDILWMQVSKNWNYAAKSLRSQYLNILSLVTQFFGFEIL